MGLPTAKAYVSDADADSYFVGSFHGNEWMALTIGEKTIALREATRWLETLCYKGELCQKTQPLKWPRTTDEDDCCPAADCTTIPPQLEEATCELALQLHKNQTSIIGGSTATTGAIQSQQLGDLSQSFYDGKSGSAATRKYGPMPPMVLQKFQWLGDLLGCYMRASYGSSRIIQRVRS